MKRTKYPEKERKEREKEKHRTCQEKRVLILGLDAFTLRSDLFQPRSNLHIFFLAADLTFTSVETACRCLPVRVSVFMD